MNWQRKILKPWINDVVAVAFLVSMAIVLYFSQVTRLSLSMDGFLLTYLKQTGDFLAFNFDEIKEPGRPFVGLGWHIAALLTGGTVTGYNAFMFSCLMFSAILVYFLVRTLLPRQPVWALLAGTFKIVWSANYEVFDNSGLAIYFAETLFWLAFWLLTLLALKHERLSWFELISASLVMMVCILVAVGTYQTPWPIVVVTPLALIALGVMRPRIYHTYWLLVIWYLAALPMMIWCYILSRQFLAHITPPMREICKRFLTGLWATTGQALLVPFAKVKTYPSYGISTTVVITTIIFAALLVLMGIQSWPALRDKSHQQVVRALMVIAIIGMTVIAISLMPPLLKWTPVYGTRMMHWSSIGTILGVVAALAGLYKMYHWIGGAVSTVIAAAIVAGMAQQTLNIGNHYANVGFQNRRFWEDLSVELSNVEEGTVVLMEGPPSNISTVDEFSSFVFRTFTETHLSFFITDGKPMYDPIKKIYEITSTVDINQVEPFVPPSKYSRYPKVLAQSHTFQVPANRVVWVEWDVIKRRLQVIPERSAMERLHRNLPSTYGQLLFPKLSIEHNRVR